MIPAAKIKTKLRQPTSCPNTHSLLHQLATKTAKQAKKARRKRRQRKNEEIQ